MPHISLYAEYLVSYDVQDTKARTALFNALKDVGLIPIQKSVFWGWLIPAECKMVQRLFRDKLDTFDSAFIVPCKLSQQPNGYIFNTQLPQNRRPDGYGIF